MPRVDILVKLKDGQSILLTEGDRIEKTVTIECNSRRCESRHGQDKPQEVSLVDGQPMPPEGRQWLSLILPEASPQYTPMPPNFCSPSCVRDFLTCQYIAPSSAGVQEVQKMDSCARNKEVNDKLDQITELLESPEVKEKLAASGEYVDKQEIRKAREFFSNSPEPSLPTSLDGPELASSYCSPEQIEWEKNHPVKPEPTVIGQADGAGE